MPEDPHPLAPDEEEDVPYPGIALPGVAIPGRRGSSPITSTEVIPGFANAIPTWVEFETVVLDGQLIRRRRRKEDELA